MIDERLYQITHLICRLVFLRNSDFLEIVWRKVKGVRRIKEE